MIAEDNYRVAYLLMVHKFPTQVRRLVERLAFEGSTFWVHVDAQSDLKSFEDELSGLPNIHFIKNRQNGDWGWFPFTQANYDGIKAIHESGAPYDHLVILSGQDYLLCPNDTWLARLKEHRTSSFVHFTEVTSDNNPHVMERVSKYHIRLSKKRKIVYPYDEKSFSKQLINNILRISGKYPLPRKIPGNDALYFGSNWLRLSRKAVQYLVSYIEQHPAYTDFFQTTLLAEEHYFHTILMNASEEERGPVINTNLTFCHWKRAPELYKIPLSMSDLDNLIQSKDLLARKFDQSYDTKLMDYLDKHFA